MSARRTSITIAMYFLSLIVVQPFLQMGVIGYPLPHRVKFALWQACGPFSTVIPFDAAVLGFINIWAVWLVIACTTLLKRPPAWQHFVMGCLWCISGCPGSMVDA